VTASSDTTATLLAFIEACCKKAARDVDERNYGWAEFTMARAQQAADAYLTLAKAGAT
jgi:hypothetical protein